MGRPSDYSEELCAVICGRLCEGESLRAICRDPEMPVISTVMLWLTKHEKFTEQYTRAREIQADSMFEEILEIADDGTNDWMDKKNQDGETIGSAVDHEHVNRSRLRVDSRKWILARMNPRKYGDAVNLKHSGDAQNPVQLLVSQLQGSAVPFAATVTDDE